MRTTLKIDDDVLNAAKTLARLEERPLGSVVSELARKGLRPTSQPVMCEGFPVFSTNEGVHPINEDTVKAALDDGS